MRAIRPILKRRTTPFRGPIFHVDRDVVRLAGGQRATYDVVRHRGSVVLLAQPRPGELVLIRQFRWAIGRWIWELPAGTLEAGEPPARAARRECAEEIGLWPGRIERLMSPCYPTPGFCDERMIFYRCTELRKPARPIAGDEDEELEPRTFRLAEVRRMIARGSIVDLKTIAGVALL